MIRPRVLVADDHAAVRAALVAVLDLIGLEVVGQATDGAEAVALAEELAPDLMVMDLSMPVLNGLDATRLLRDTLPATPRVVFTAFASDELEHAAHTAGAVACVVKDTTVERRCDHRDLPLEFLGQNLVRMTRWSSSLWDLGLLRAFVHHARGR